MSDNIPRFTPSPDFSDWDEEELSTSEDDDDLTGNEKQHQDLLTASDRPFQVITPKPRFVLNRRENGRRDQVAVLVGGGASKYDLNDQCWCLESPDSSNPAR